MTRNTGFCTKTIKIGNRTNRSLKRSEYVRIYFSNSPEITVENGFKLSQRLSQTMWKHMRFFVRQNCPIVLEWPVNPNQRQLVTCNGKAASIIVLQF